MESEPTMKITGMLKLHPVENMANLFEAKQDFSAEEIFAVAQKLRQSRAGQMTDIHFRSFRDDSYYVSNRRFVTDTISSLSVDTLCFLLTSDEGNKCLKNFLLEKDLGNTLQTTYGDFRENAGQRRVGYHDTKEKLVNLLIANPKNLIYPNDTPIMTAFFQNFLISLNKLKDENICIEPSLTLGIKETIIFNFTILNGLVPNDPVKGKPRFFKLTCNPRDDLPGMRAPAKTFEEFQEFFKTTKSSASDVDCVLDMEGTKGLEVLKKFIPSIVAVDNLNDKEFVLEPIGYPISVNDLEQLNADPIGEEKKQFRVKWPNSLEGLGNLFGQRAKSKFLTLSNGLGLLERLEPSQKFIELMQGKKIMLDLSSNRYFRSVMGTSLEAKALEVLILHLKLESVQENDLMICTVQEKITEETLAYIWQRVEGSNMRHYNTGFIGFQLTE